MGFLELSDMGFLKYAAKLPSTLFLIFLIDGLAGWFLLNKDNPHVPAFVFILILSLILAACLHYLEERSKGAESALQKLRQNLEQSIGKEDERISWTRPMLQQPLPPTDVASVFPVFDAALTEATQALREIFKDAEGSKIRVNLFLPTSDGARFGDVCDLTIPRDKLNAPEGLQRNMPREEALRISFRPNQGATGRVFVEGRAIGTLTNPTWLAKKDTPEQKDLDRWVYVRLHPESGFDEHGKSVLTESGEPVSGFEMTDFQNHVVSGNLAWIVSMPVFLRTDSALEVVGVFNVDCLDYQLKPEQLRALYYRIVPFAGALSGVLRRLPTDRVAIFRFRG